MAFDEDWDFDSHVANQCDMAAMDSAWDEQCEEDAASAFLEEPRSPSPRLPCDDSQTENTPSPPPLRKELSLSPTPKVRKSISKKRPATPIEKAHIEHVIKGRDAKSKSVVQWGEHGWPAITDEKFDKMEPRAKYFLFYNRLRQWISRKDFGHKDKEELAMLERAVTHWKQMAKESKALVVQQFLQALPAPPVLLEFARNQWPTGQGDGKALATRSVLFTWNGHWGLFDSVPEQVTGESEVLSWLRDNADLKSVWDDFVQWLGTLAERLGSEAYGCSFEVAGGTWATARQVRVHAHCFIKKDSRMRLSSETPLMFRGSLPNRAGHISGQSMRCVGSWAGMYYVVAPKHFSLYTFSSKAPFSDFMVSPEWIFNLVQAGKISYDNAKAELIKCGKGLTRRLMDLEKWRTAKAEQELIVRATKVQEQLRGSMKKFREFPAVREWFNQSTGGLRARKKFLVITGPSGVGKSEFVRSLFPLGAVLELNCAGVKDVCLAAFDAQKHQCIFWDELAVLVVANNRKIFQHPACWVDLGHSPTGSHVAYHWLNDAVSIVASNRWYDDLQSLKSYSDRCWVEANSVVLVVDVPMWISQ